MVWVAMADRAKNTQTYKHHDAIPETVLKCNLPVFEHLSDDDLLKKCLHGGRQNRNESFHSLVWGIQPKEQIDVIKGILHFVT